LVAGVYSGWSERAEQVHEYKGNLDHMGKLLVS
jgi:hypothetical protein